MNVKNSNDTWVVCEICNRIYLRYDKEKGPKIYRYYEGEFDTFDDAQTKANQLNDHIIYSTQYRIWSPVKLHIAQKYFPLNHPFYPNPFTDKARDLRKRGIW